MDAVSPGDPMEEGWVKDAVHDSRARHWRSDRLGYRPVTSSDGALKALTTGGGGGSSGEGGGSGAGGGGGSSGEGSGGGDSYGDNGEPLLIISQDGTPLPVAALVVYSVLVITLAYLWWTVHLVVAKPEVMSAKVDKMIVWLGHGSQKLRRLRQTAQASARADYRTVCVAQEGRDHTTRCGTSLQSCLPCSCWSQLSGCEAHFYAPRPGANKPVDVRHRSLSLSPARDAPQDLD
jgi:hypothetical protein